MVTEGDLTLGGEHTIQYTDDTLQNCSLETYIIILTNVTPNKFNVKNRNRLIDTENRMTDIRKEGGWEAG